jgi:hypothetical protein
MTLNRNFGFLRVAALGLGLVGLMTLAHAESDTAEQERIAKFNKQNGGGRASTLNNKTTFHGGGGPAVTQTQIVAGQNQLPMLNTESDAKLRAAQDKYAEIVAQGGFPKVPKGAYKKGAKSVGVIALNKRLFMEGYLRVEGTQGEFASIYTSATADAVSRYQRNMGLGATGNVDNATLAELNISAEERLRTITANIPRLDIYGKGLGDRYLVVNVPAQQLETVSGGYVYSRHNVIVGRPERPSPVVMTPLVTVKFNPYWNAPVSIVERDIIPKILNGTDVLENMNMKVFEGIGGPEIDPNTVNWSKAIPDDYAFRQEPGPENAMKTAKIEFNSTFGIYLHDTPEPQLFKTNNRFYSSGCIRVEKMPLLVQWVLNGQDGFGEAKIATMAETLERLDVPLVDPAQLRVAYLTAWPTANGTIAFRRDIYGMDSSGFTVGQPMPVGEKSPDGLRYVLKPLPRQLPVDVAEAEGFHLFGRSTKKANGISGLKTNIFGKSLLTATKVSNKKASTDPTPPEPDVLDVIVAKTKPTKTSKVPKVKLKSGKSAEKFVGLFDWAAYRQEQASGAKAPKTKKKSAKTLAATKVNKVAPDAKKVKAADATKVKAAETAKVKASDKSKVADATKAKAADTTKVKVADKSKPRPRFRLQACAQRVPTVKFQKPAHQLKSKALRQSVSGPEVSILYRAGLIILRGDISWPRNQ